jgi:hypothetical protein
MRTRTAQRELHFAGPPKARKGSGVTMGTAGTIFLWGTLSTAQLELHLLRPAGRTIFLRLGDRIPAVLVVPACGRRTPVAHLPGLVHVCTTTGNGCLAGGYFFSSHMLHGARRALHVARRAMHVARRAMHVARRALHVARLTSW